ncbi:putative Charged multivesicular body protein 1 [Paratrimastix pyriformis]|uniref:Charged multivesicular body protein 1 n=1 Tax=Paratrimastix pyriformis TaxID=342808 RepID=A0ABQ8UG87_9EUKA|nr:putative Charged multivesicular body protein 1 [Paratrimastix pyriformis]|eukprot:GAFH01004685.1.p2 GENE.GAFH01004685.1~~GAFH01004685.1.p2  ORF type:complete len:222 (-),score=65.44 GAFH01004685.1:85-720(-)
MGASESRMLEKQLFDLKFTSKQLIRMSKKAEKDEAADKLKLKAAIEKNNSDGARIYAQNAIRNKQQALNYLRLSSRVDAVASRLEAAVRMNQVTHSMGQVVHGLDSALASMNTEKISRIMDKFEKQFEDLDVQQSYVEGAINQTTSLVTPVDQVDTLIQQVADEHHLDVSHMLPAPATTVPEAQAVAAPAPTERPLSQQDELTDRLNHLQH